MKVCTFFRLKKALWTTTTTEHPKLDIQTWFGIDDVSITLSFACHHPRLTWWECDGSTQQQKRMGKNPKQPTQPWTTARLDDSTKATPLGQPVQ